MKRCRRCGMDRTARREDCVADSKHSGGRGASPAPDPTDLRTEASDLETARREHLRRNGDIRTDEEAVRCVVAMQAAVPGVKLDRLGLTRDRSGGNYTFWLDGIRIQELLPVWQPPRWLLTGEPRRMRTARAAMHRQRARAYMRGKAGREVLCRPRGVGAAAGSRCWAVRTRRSGARSRNRRRTASSGGGSSGKGESGSPGDPPARSIPGRWIWPSRTWSAASGASQSIARDGGEK